MPSTLTSRLRVPAALLAVFGAGVFAASTAARADVVAVGARADLNANDSTDWSASGPTFTSLSSPFATASVFGDSLSVSDVGGGFERRDEGNGWGGAFAAGAALLWNESNGAITIQFATPVSGVGTQLQLDDGGPTTATIQAFNAAGVALDAPFSFTGDSSGDEDNSALFLGLSDSTAEISSIVLTATAGADTTDFAINDVSIAGVPEPGVPTLLCLAALVGGAVIYRRRATLAS